MKLTENDFNQILTVITNRSGIIPRESHRDGIRLFIEKQLEDIGGVSPLEEYKFLLESNGKELTNLVNESTVNETYFFREEKQFAFLARRVFPEWIALHGNAMMNVWCAACSSGEEAYSLALLARDCRIVPQITASDIDTKVLDICSTGIYRAQSKRMSDGTVFHHLLAPYMTETGGYSMPGEIRSLIHTKQINLASLETAARSGFLPMRQHIIFLRNVFIYFSRELRAKILKIIAEKCLVSGGYLFVSMSEVASIDSEITPDGLEKRAEGNVFYFHKK